MNEILIPQTLVSSVYTCTVRAALEYVSLNVVPSVINGLTSSTCFFAVFLASQLDYEALG